MPLDESIVGRARLGLLLLLGAIGGVVLIACANLANLSLTRTLGRMREAAVRSALGASRARLVGGVVLEQLLLAATGGALGVLVAREALNLFVTTAPIDLPRVNDVVIDGRVIAFAALVAIVAGLVSRCCRPGAWDAATCRRRCAAADTARRDRGGQRVRATLLAVQVALSVTLLVVTGLFVTSFVQLLRVDPGFSPERVTAVEIAPLANRYPDEKARAALYDRILASARDLPGITSAAWTSALPLTGETWVDLIARIGDTRPSSQKSSANYRFIGPDYFRTLSMPHREGPRHRRARPESGRRCRPSSPRARRRRCGRAKTRSASSSRVETPASTSRSSASSPTATPTALEAESPLMVYVPYWFNNEGKSVLMVRTPGEAAAIAGELRRVIHAVDPEIAIADVEPAATGRRQGAGRPPLPDVAVRRVRRGRARDCDGRGVRDDGVRRVAAAPRDEHPRGARRARLAGDRARAAPEPDPVVRWHRGRLRRCTRDWHRRRQPAVQGTGGRSRSCSRPSSHSSARSACSPPRPPPVRGCASIRRPRSGTNSNPTSVLVLAVRAQSMSEHDIYTVLTRRSHSAQTGLRHFGFPFLASVNQMKRPMNTPHPRSKGPRRTVLSLGFASLLAVCTSRAEAAFNFTGVSAGDASSTKVTLWTRAVDDAAPATAA